MGATRVFETPAAVPPASQSLAMARMGFSAGAATTTALRSDCNPTIVSECWHFRHNASSRFSYTITAPPPPPPRWGRLYVRWPQDTTVQGSKRSSPRHFSARRNICHRICGGRWMRLHVCCPLPWEPRGRRPPKIRWELLPASHGKGLATWTALFSAAPCSPGTRAQASKRNATHGMRGTCMVVRLTDRGESKGDFWGVPHKNL